MAHIQDRANRFVQRLFARPREQAKAAPSGEGQDTLTALRKRVATLKRIRRKI